MISAKFKKAKKGDMFYESPNAYDEPRVWRFVRLTAPISTFKEPYVVFESLDGRETFSISADDRYGHFPPLTVGNANKILKRLDDLHAELKTYQCLRKQIADVRTLRFLSAVR